MRTATPHAWIVAALCLAVACCPFPRKRTTLIRPEGTVRVLDASTGEPIEGAEVVLRRVRVGPPPHIESHSWTATTDAAGEASFELELGTETVMPLMMHGVPQWGFEACATHPGHGGAWSSWLVVPPPSDRSEVGRIAEPLVLELEPGGDEACPWEILEKGS
jgi:hypothetical protein